MSKFSFIKSIYQSAIEHQNREIKKAIINQSSEHHLNENAAYLHVALETWKIGHTKRNRGMLLL